MPSLSSSSRSSRSRHRDEEGEQEEVQRLGGGHAHSRTSSVSSLSSVSNNRGGGARGKSTRRGGLNARFDRLLGSTSLSNTLIKKRKNSAEMELGLGNKRLKVEAGLERVPRYGRKGREEEDEEEDEREEGDGFREGGGGGGRTDVYLGREVEEESMSQHNSPHPPVTPPSWLTSTLSSLPHNNALYNPDRHQLLFESRPLPLRRTRSSTHQLLARPEQLQPHHPSPMSAQDYFSSLSSSSGGGTKARHSWGGESNSSSAAYTHPSSFGRLRSEVSPPISFEGGPSNRAFYDHHPPFHPFSQQQQQQQQFFDPEGGPNDLPLRTFVGRDQAYLLHQQQQQQQPFPNQVPPHRPLQQQQHAFYPSENQNQNQFQNQDFAPPFHRPSPRPFNPEAHQQLFSSNTSSHTDFNHPPAAPRPHMLPPRQIQNPPPQQQQQQRPVFVVSPPPPPRPLVRKPSATVLREQDYLLDEPEISQMQKHNGGGGVPFSRPGPGSREMMDDGMGEEEEEEMRRRRGGGDGGMMMAMQGRGGLEAGSGGIRASGMVGYPGGGGGSNFGEDEDASRNGEGSPWMGSQLPGPRPSAFNFQRPIPTRPAFGRPPPIPLPQHFQQQQHQIGPAPRMINFVQNSIPRSPQRFGLPVGGPQQGEQQQFRFGVDGPFLAQHRRNLPSVPVVVPGPQVVQRASTPAVNQLPPQQQPVVGSPRPTSGCHLTPVREEERSSSSKNSNRFEDASEGHRTPKQLQQEKPTTPSTPIQPNSKASASVPNSLPPPAPKKTPQLLKTDPVFDRSSWEDRRLNGEDVQLPSSFPLQDFPASQRSNPSPVGPAPPSRPRSTSVAPAAAPPSTASASSRSSSNSKVITRQPQPFPFQFTYTPENPPPPAPQAPPPPISSRPTLRPRAPSVASPSASASTSAVAATASPQIHSQPRTPTIFSRIEEIQNELQGGAGLVDEPAKKGVRLEDIAPRSGSVSGSGRNIDEEPHQEPEPARTDSPPIPSTRKKSKKNSSGSGNKKSKPVPLPPPAKTTKRKKRIILEDDEDDEDDDGQGVESAVAAFEREERKERERFERSESIESFEGDHRVVPPPAAASRGPRRVVQQWMTMDAEEEQEEGGGGGERSGEYEGDDERARSGTTGSGSVDFFSGEAGPGFEIFEDAEE